MKNGLHIHAGLTYTKTEQIVRFPPNTKIRMPHGVRSDTQGQARSGTNTFEEEREWRGGSIKITKRRYGCDEERWRAHTTEESVENGYYREINRGRPKTRWKDACQRDLKRESGQGTDRAMRRRKQSYNGDGKACMGKEEESADHNLCDATHAYANKASH